MPGFGAKAQLTVTIDFRDLQAAAADATGQLVFGDGLSAATVRRLACDAKIIPLVLGTNSEPLDVGRSERLVTRAIRRALNARDNGCVVCNVPPVMCDAHHLVSWVDGGETKVDNLVLLCRRHHVDLHAGRWTIAITNGKVQVARPALAESPPGRRKRARTEPSPTWRGGTQTAPPPAWGERTRAVPSSACGEQTQVEQPSACGEQTQVEQPSAWGDRVRAETSSARVERMSEPSSGWREPVRDERAGESLADATATTELSGVESGARVSRADGEGVPDGAGAALASVGRSVVGESVVAFGRKSRWKADEGALREAAEFALIDTPAS
ncbi:DUF222 domain-containing protein [Kribbella sp. WER1]